MGSDPVSTRFKSINKRNEYVMGSETPESRENVIDNTPFPLINFSLPTATWGASERRGGARLAVSCEAGGWLSSSKGDGKGACHHE